MKLKNKIERTLVKESIFYVGKVSSIQGRTVKIKVDKEKNLSNIFYEGELIKNITVGSYLKICKGLTKIIGKVEGEEIEEDKFLPINPQEKQKDRNHQKKQKDRRLYSKESMKINRVLRVSLFGYFKENDFMLGIKEMPLIDNECYLLERGEFIDLHKFHDDETIAVDIGRSIVDPSIKITLSIDKLFAGHTGIFGNTGSGKSNTLARAFFELFNQDNNELESGNSIGINSKFVMIDFNGEYAKLGNKLNETALKNKVKIYNLTDSDESCSCKYPLRLGKEDMDIIYALLNATEKTQKPFLKRAISSDYFDEDFDNRALKDFRDKIKEILNYKGTNPRGLLIDYLGDIKEILASSSSKDSKESVKVIKDIMVEANKIKYNATTRNFFVTKGTLDYYYSEDKTEDKVTFLKLFFTSRYSTEVPDVLLLCGGISFPDKPIFRLQFKIISAYYHEIMKGYSNRDFIAPLIGRVHSKFKMLRGAFKISDVDEHKDDVLEIIDIDNTSLEMKKTIPLLICRQLFNQHKKEGKPPKKSLHIIVDEAHNILSYSSLREDETWKDYRLETFEEIIKEGRKFGIFVVISSQRPQDISTTLISQMHNYIVHRLVNERDLEALRNAISYMGETDFSNIPILPAGVCFIAGQCSGIPVGVQVALLDEDTRPISETISLSKAWEKKL